jgi:hypothetical protein
LSLRLLMTVSIASVSLGAQSMGGCSMNTWCPVRDTGQGRHECVSGQAGEPPNRVETSPGCHSCQMARVVAACGHTHTHLLPPVCRAGGVWRSRQLNRLVCVRQGAPCKWTHVRREKECMSDARGQASARTHAMHRPHVPQRTPQPPDGFRCEPANVTSNQPQNASTGPPSTMGSCKLATWSACVVRV